MTSTQNEPQFLTIQPKILYFGTPVALITTVDVDGNANIGPISSAWALGYNVMLGMGCDSKTYHNLINNKECVVNLPSANLYQNIERISNLTGLNPVPENKRERYRYEKDKFAAGNFKPMPAQIVKPPAISNCPIQLECTLENHYVIESNIDLMPLIACMHMKVINVRIHDSLLINGNHINPSEWSPLIYNFRHYYSLGEKMGKNFRAEV